MGSSRITVRAPQMHLEDLDALAVRHAEPFQQHVRLGAQPPHPR